MMKQMMGGMALPGMRRGQKSARKAKGGKGRKGGRPGGSPANRAAAGNRAAASDGGVQPGGPAGLPADAGQRLLDGLPRGLPDGLGGADGAFRLPGRPGFGTPQPNLPPGLRGPVPGRRGRPGKKGR
jgi:hypothetical protein